MNNLQFFFLRRANHLEHTRLISGENSAPIGNLGDSYTYTFEGIKDNKPDVVTISFYGRGFNIGDTVKWSYNKRYIVTSKKKFHYKKENLNLKHNL